MYYYVIKSERGYYAPSRRFHNIETPSAWSTSLKGVKLYKTAAAAQSAISYSMRQNTRWAKKHIGYQRWPQPYNKFEVIEVEIKETGKTKEYRFE